MPQRVPFFVTSFDILRIHHPSRTRLAPARKFHCLSYCIHGKADFSTDTTNCSSGEGSVTFIPQGVPFTTATAEEREIIAIHFNVSGKLPREFRVFLPSQSLDLEKDFTKLLELYDSIDDDKGLVCIAQFYKLLNKIFDGNGFRNDLSGFDRRILPALDYLNKNYADRSAADVEHLASLCGFSASYLRRIFMQEFGMSTSTYVKQFRINKACSLLISGYYSVTEVAMQCGFNTTSYFAKEFRRHIGMTPSEYTRTKLTPESAEPAEE